MKKHLLLLMMLIATSHFLFAQYGITGGLSKMNVPTWQIPLDNYVTKAKSNFLKNGVSFELDRKFGLKNIRIDFYPGIRYSKYTSLLDEAKFEWVSAGFQVTTKFYTFDLEGNCNCPTFGNGGETFKKGFHFTLTPGVDYVFLKHKPNPVDSYDIHIDRELIIPNIAGGAGLDIGLSDLLTLTPSVGLRYYPVTKWEGLTKQVSKGLETEKYDENRIFQFYFGIRIGLNFS